MKCSLFVASCVGLPRVDSALPNGYSLADNCQNVTILHCVDWTCQLYDFVASRWRDSQYRHTYGSK